MTSRRLLLVLPLVFALAASACGSSKNTTASSGGSSTTSAPATTAPPTTALTPTTVASSGPATVSTGNSSIGTVLVNSAGRTLYHLDKDTASTFACTGGCLSAWPPLTVSGGSPVAGTGVTGTLGVRARPDGSQQVTWNGMPLYTFVGDSAPGDAKGDGLGGVWHAAKLSAAGAGAGAGATTTTAGYGGTSYP